MKVNMINLLMGALAVVLKEVPLDGAGGGGEFLDDGL